MPYIETVPVEEAEGAVAAMYAKQQGTGESVPAYAQLFSHNPALMAIWADMLRAIKSGLPRRDFYLVNFAVARAIDSQACQEAFAARMLAEGFTPGQLGEIIGGNSAAALTGRQQSMIEFAVKIACDSANVVAGDVDTLRDSGVGDNEIFHLAAAAASRCFFARLCDGLGAGANVDPQVQALLRAGPRPFPATVPTGKPGAVSKCEP